MPKASSLAAEIESTFGVKPQLVKSAGGCFEITVDNELIFSKKELDRFPNDGEVLEELSKRSANH